MIIDPDKDEIMFEATGRKEYANNGIIGLSPLMHTGQGADGGFDDDSWSPAERRELAECMKALWERFAVEGPGP